MGGGRQVLSIFLFWEGVVFRSNSYSNLLKSTRFFSKVADWTPSANIKSRRVFTTLRLKHITASKYCIYKYYNIYIYIYIYIYIDIYICCNIAKWWKPLKPQHWAFNNKSYTACSKCLNGQATIETLLCTWCKLIHVSHHHKYKISPISYGHNIGSAISDQFEKINCKFSSGKIMCQQLRIHPDRVFLKSFELFCRR